MPGAASAQSITGHPGWTVPAWRRRLPCLFLAAGALVMALAAGLESVVARTWFSAAAEAGQPA